MSFLQEQRSYSPLSLHMMSTRLSTARTQRPPRARYVHTPCENSKLSHDLDVIVKSLAWNSCERNPSILDLAPRVPVSVENKADCPPSRKCSAMDIQLPPLAGTVSRRSIERGI